MKMSIPKEKIKKNVEGKSKVQSCRRKHRRIGILINSTNEILEPVTQGHQNDVNHTTTSRTT